MPHVDQCLESSQGRWSYMRSLWITMHRSEWSGIRQVRQVTVCCSHPFLVGWVVHTVWSYLGSFPQGVDGSAVVLCFLFFYSLFQLGTCLGLYGCPAKPVTQTTAAYGRTRLDCRDRPLGSCLLFLISTQEYMCMRKIRPGYSRLFKETLLAQNRA